MGKNQFCFLPEKYQYENMGISQRFLHSEQIFGSQELFSIFVYFLNQTVKNCTLLTKCHVGCSHKELSFIFAFISPKADIFLNGLFQFLRADTYVPLCYIDTGMLEQGSDQFDVVMIIHIHVGGKAFTKAVRAYPIQAKIGAY